MEEIRLAMELENDMEPDSCVTSKSRTDAYDYGQDEIDETNLDADRLDGVIEDVHKRKRGVAKVYSFFKEYEDSELAVTALISGSIDETTWRKKTTKQNKARGIIHTYKCVDCSKSLYLLYHHTASSVSVYIEDQEHDHDKPVKPDNFSYGYRIPQKTKEKAKRPKRRL